MSDKNLATIQVVSELSPIPNADAIEEMIKKQEKHPLYPTCQKKFYIQEKIAEEMRLMFAPDISSEDFNTAPDYFDIWCKITRWASAVAISELNSREKREWYKFISISGRKRA